MKGLEALNDLRVRVYCSNNGEFFERLDIIEKELKEYEQHKAIEEERGIDIRVLDRMLKNGAYFKNPYQHGEKIQYFNDLYPHLDLKNNRFDIRMYLFVGQNHYSTGGALFPFKSYGELFALTREELENE